MTTLSTLVSNMQAREAAREARGEPPAYVVEAESSATAATWILPGHGRVRREPGGRCVRLSDGAVLPTVGWGYPA